LFKPSSILALGFIGFALSACQEAPQEGTGSDSGAEQEAKPFGQALISDASGNEIGSASLASLSDKVTITLTGSGLEPGEKAFHLHTTGACDAPDFKSAQGHLNPFSKRHGAKSEGGKHLGDLPNIDVGEDGSFQTDFTLDETLSEIEQHLFDEDGTAVMIHEGADDYETDPTGGAGGRVACGILQSLSN